MVKEKVRIRDGGVCVYCNEKLGEYYDHIYARHRGGKTTLDNIVLCCQKCNNKKGVNLYCPLCLKPIRKCKCDLAQTP